MLIHLKTFDGHNINDWANYRAALLSPRSTPAAKAVFVEQTEADAVDAGTYTVETMTRVVAIEVANYAQRHALISQLKGWFRRGTLGALVGRFADDGVDYQLECRVVNLTQDPERPLRWNAVLASSATTWRSVDPQTDAWTVVDSGGTKAIDVGGDDETRLVASFTGTDLPGTGYTKQNMYQLPNVPKINLGYTPWCITLDSAALVAAGKLLASCYDLRVFDGDVELKRWIVDPNTSATKVWFNIEFRAGYALKLKTAVNNSSAVATLEFVVDATHKTAIAAMPNEGIIYHGTEWFAYSGRDATNCKLTVRERGAYGTTKQAHIANDVFYYIQHPLRIVYGNPNATNPALDDDAYDSEKPIFDLSQSDNTKWVYTASTKFYDATMPSRTGQFVLTEARLGDVSKLYHVKEDAETGDPAMGIKAGSYYLDSAPKADTVTLAFSLWRGCGFSKVTATGRKYKSKSNWFTYNGFQWSALGGAAWTTLWAEATPSALTTWQSWVTHSAVAVNATARFIRFATTGTFAAVAGAYALSECLTLTLEFITTNLPTGTFLGEANNYMMDLILRNEATGDAMSLRYPALYDVAFLADGENHVAAYGNVNAHRAIALDDESRDVWVRLRPGANTLRIEATDVGEMEVALAWYRRRLG